MNQVQRVAVAIYLACFLLMLLPVVLVIAPFFAKVSGVDGRLITWSLLAASVAAGVWTMRSILKDDHPLQRLGIMLSARPNRGSQGPSGEVPPEPEGPTPDPEPPVLPGDRNHAITPK